MSFVERTCVTVDMAAKQATIGDYYRGGIPRNSHGGYITFVAIIANCVRLVGVNSDARKCTVMKSPGERVQSAECVYYGGSG